MITANIDDSGGDGDGGEGLGGGGDGEGGEGLGGGSEGLGGGGESWTQSILGYEVSCVLPVGTVPRRISQWPALPPVRTPPHASPAAMQAVLAAVMLP